MNDFSKGNTGSGATVDWSGLLDPDVDVNGGRTVATVLGMTVDDVSLNAVANLGWQEITLRAPVFTGDTIYAQSVVSEVRESRSRPGQGIVTTDTRGLKQTGEVFLTFRRSRLAPTREAADLAL